ncbi:hypothetical protein [Micromonospora sp. NPDC049679]|uniref:hypothetical protein n=1 Tax=Micromonospora sp. NPDC049679 TaxID=3155920 RepID=UPI00340677D0
MTKGRHPLPYFVLILVDQHHVRYGAIALIMAITIAIAAPFGLALSAALPRELEGTLVLLMVIGLQMVADPANPATRLLPWFSREIGTYAIDHSGGGYLARGLVHGAVFALALTALVAAAARLRLRHRSHLRFSVPR